MNDNNTSLTYINTPATSKVIPDTENDALSFSRSARLYVKKNFSHTPAAATDEELGQAMDGVYSRMMASKKMTPVFFSN